MGWWEMNCEHEHFARRKPQKSRSGFGRVASGWPQDGEDKVSRPRDSPVATQVENRQFSDLRKVLKARPAMTDHGRNFNSDHRSDTQDTVKALPSGGPKYTFRN